MLSTLKLRLGKTAMPDHRESFSQSGEDILMDYVLGWMRIPTRSYLDIGAHHPTFLSNTYLFYHHGHRGVCVEPDPSLYAEIARVRPRDTNLNIGVGSKTQDATFYVMRPTTLNTFSKPEAEAYIKHYPDTVIEKEVQLPITTINKILEDNFDQTPDMISIDVEGLDFEILTSLDFKRFRPAVFCIETIQYGNNGALHKAKDVMAFMEKQGYFAYADTFTNTIFVDSKKWKSQNMPKLG